MNKGEFVGKLRELVSEFGFEEFLCIVGKNNVIDLAVSPLPADKISGQALDAVLEAAIQILGQNSSSASAEYFVVKNKS